jgi:hypothetical protein
VMMMASVCVCVSFLRDIKRDRAAQLPTAVDGGPFVGPGLKPLFSSERHGVTPLADAARRTVSLVAASGAPLAAGDPGPRRN